MALVAILQFLLKHSLLSFSSPILPSLLSLSFLSFRSLPFLPLSFLPLKVGHLNAARGLAECCKLPEGVWGKALADKLFGAHLGQ